MRSLLFVGDLLKVGADIYLVGPLQQHWLPGAFLTAVVGHQRQGAFDSEDSAGTYGWQMFFLLMFTNQTR